MRRKELGEFCRVSRSPPAGLPRAGGFVALGNLRGGRAWTGEAAGRRLVRLRARDVIDENLRVAFPEMTARERRWLTRRMWEHLLLMAVRIAHRPAHKIHDTNWRQLPSIF